jgi:ketosteroid isomerase-like protein
MLRAVMLVLILAFGAAPPSLAEKPALNQSEAIARAYMQAYSEANWDAMAPYMADDYVLIDRTNPDPSFEPEYKGPDAALQMMRAFGRDQGVIELGFEFPVVFESNGIVVFSGFVNVHAAPPGVDFAYKWRTEQVSVITVKDGRILRHEDFANYGGATMTRLPRPHAE